MTLSMAQSDILDTAFISSGLSSQDISVSIADDYMGSDHLPIQISLDKSLTEPCYEFHKTNDDLLPNTLKENLTSIDTNITTQDELDELAVTLSNKLTKAVKHPHLKCTAAMTPNLLLVKPS